MTDDTKFCQNLYTQLTDLMNNAKNLYSTLLCKPIDDLESVFNSIDIESTKWYINVDNFLTMLETAYCDYNNSENPKSYIDVSPIKSVQYLITEWRYEFYE